MKNSNNPRREFLKKSALLGIAGFALPSFLKGMTSSDNISENFAEPIDGLFTLPALPYAYDALEPHIDKMTMEIHHTKHHQAYVDNLNKACKENNISASLDDIFKNISKYPMTVRNNGGGHWNHSFFWKLMKANGGGVPSGKLAEAINASFESFDDFKYKFSDAAKSRFGSGWAWLVKTSEGKLVIGNTGNQDNPLMGGTPVLTKDASGSTIMGTGLNGTPILALDVWEHAYYLKYQNRRADYISAWWNVVNWDEAAKNFAG
jgi:Fe-Mn family superoxide dismutase